MADLASIKQSLLSAFRDFKIDGVPASGLSEPDKAAIRASLAQLVDIGVSSGTTLVFATVADLNAEAGPFVNAARAEVRADPAGDVPNGNGVYTYDLGDDDWVWIAPATPLAGDIALVASAVDLLNQFTTVFARARPSGSTLVAATQVNSLATFVNAIPIDRACNLFQLRLYNMRALGGQIEVAAYTRSGTTMTIVPGTYRLLNVTAGVGVKTIPVDIDFLAAQYVAWRQVNPLLALSTVTAESDGGYYDSAALTTSMASSFVDAGITASLYFQIGFDFRAASVDQAVEEYGNAVLLPQSATILRGTFAETITVKPSGGDFTTISAAIDSISDSSPSKQYKIVWSAGSTLGSPNRHVPPWTTISCVDRNEDAIIYYELPDDASASLIRNTQLLWLDEDMSIIEGGTWRLKNGRYPFHPDSFSNFPYSEQRMINLVAEHLGNESAINNDWNIGSQFAAGCGTSDGQTIRVIDSQLIGPAGGFSVHGPNNGEPWERPWLCDLQGSRFVATEPGQNSISIAPIGVGPGRVSLTACTLDSMRYTDGQWAIDPGPSVNTAQIEVVAASCTPFSFVNAIGKGSLAGRDYLPTIVGAEGLSPEVVQSVEELDARTRQDGVITPASFPIIWDEESAQVYAAVIAGKLWMHTPHPDYAADMAEAIGDVVIPLAWGPENLRKYQLALGTMAQSGGAVDVCMLGDSTSDFNFLPEPLSRTLRERYGDGGPGYFDSRGEYLVDGVPSVGYRIFRTGTWSFYDASTAVAPTFGCGPDGKSMYTTGTAETYFVRGAKVDRIVLYLEDGTSGGSFEYSVNGGAWTAVVLANAGPVYKLEVAGLDNTVDNELSLRTLTNTGRVNILGGRCVNDTGIRLHKMGNGGLQSAHQLLYFANPCVAAILADIQPDLLIHSLGTNDHRFTLSNPDTWATNLDGVVDVFRAASARCSVLLIAPANSFSAGAPQSIRTFAARQYATARAEGYGYFDLGQLLGTWDELLALGGWDDVAAPYLHPNFSCGHWMASALIYNDIL